ncbi:MAG TPA: response regulator transcription factor [Acidimicrobiales bacterium]|nr:response regulator transcription factor [Acidimicrobiales bacterium]
MQNARLLIVDDDPEIRTMLSRILTDEGYRVAEMADGEALLKAMNEQPPDLVLLDVMLAAEDGMDVLANLRRKSDVPVIMLTARGKELDRVLGLKLGADDYVVKPFSPSELTARIASVLRRTSRRPDSGTTLDFGALAIDVPTREVRLDGELVETTAKEFDLLAFLARSPRQVFSRAQLLEQVWDSSSDWQAEGTVTEHVRRIRRKIEQDPDNPRWVKTVRGVGYRFEP